MYPDIKPYLWIEYRPAAAELCKLVIETKPTVRENWRNVF